MADIDLKSFPFDSMDVLNEQSGQMEPDREYLAEVFRKYFAKFLSNGVYYGHYKNYGENSMKVLVDVGLSVKVKKGAGLIQGADFENEDDRLLTFERPASGNRVDRIVVQFNASLNERKTKLIIKQGNGTTPAELTRTENIYEICIAEVTVKSTSNITAEDIVDKRTDTELCGIVDSLISIDGEEIYQNFQNYIDSVTENLVRKDQDSTIDGNIVANSVQDANGNSLSKNNFTDAYKNKLDGVANGATKVIVDNALNASSENAVQNKVIKNAMDGKAPTNHASSGTGYGVGTISNYGHNKLINNLDRSAFVNGEALSAYQGYVLNGLIAAVRTLANNAQSAANTAQSTANNANTNANNRLPKSGGTISGNLDIEGYLSVLYNLSVLNGITTIGENISVSGGQIYVDNGSIRSQHIYGIDTVSNFPNLYITSKGWFRRTTNTSSQRYKKDIKEVKNEELNPEKLYNLKVKQFKYKKEFQPNKNDSRFDETLLGFIAEDVAEVYPIAADYEIDKDGNKIVENWNERYIIPAMLQLIQNQKKEMDELKERVSKLEGAD